MQMLKRKPQRVTATLSWQRADYEGRSLSKLVCHLLQHQPEPVA
jgi:hypothetical protein